MEPDTFGVDVDEPLGLVIAQVVGSELLTREQEAPAVVRLLKQSQRFENTVKIRIQDYIGDLKSDLVWISNGPKEIGLQMFWILNGI